jgi:hypothetical protein
VSTPTIQYCHMTGFACLPVEFLQFIIKKISNG